MAKRKGLTATTKLVNETAAALGPVPAPGPDKLSARNVRLDPDVADALRELAYITRRSQHSFMIEGLALVFQRYGLALPEQLDAAAEKTPLQTDLLSAD